MSDIISIAKMPEILKGIYEDPELRSSCIPLFMSQPGLGKTSIVNNFFKDIGKKCLPVIASTKMPHEFQGCAIPDHNTQLMTYYDYDELLNLEDGDGLFLDEMLNANPMILNAFLTVLENRTLPSGKKLKNIMIIAAANPQGAVSITPQIKERFIFYDTKYDRDYWKLYMQNKYKLPDMIFSSLSSLVENENFNSSERNYFSCRSIDKAINMMIKDVHTPYCNKLLPILNLNISNETSDNIVLPDMEWFPNQHISWLFIIQQLKKLKNEIINK